MAKHNKSNAMALLVLALNVTDVMTAAEPLRRPGFVQTYTHKARDPLVKEQRSV